MSKKSGKTRIFVVYGGIKRFNKSKKRIGGKRNAVQKGEIK